jgi:SAM-dependent methyltransferase
MSEASLPPSFTPAGLLEVSEDELARVPGNFAKGARPTWHQVRRRRAVLAMLEGLTGDIVDYGCGYGDLAAAMSRNHRVHGFDVDPTRVEFARRQYAPIPFDLCPAGGLPVATGSVDIVTSIVVVHFVPDPMAYFREIHRVLKPDGWLVLACTRPEPLRMWMRRLFRRGPPANRLWVVEREEVEAMLNTLGFQVERRGYFYDPPTDRCKNIVDVALGVASQALYLFGVERTADYYTLRLRKIAAA